MVTKTTTIDGVRHQEILDKDVEQWSKEDMKFMVDYYWTLRESFQVSEANKPKRSKKNEIPTLGITEALKVTF